MRVAWKSNVVAKSKAFTHMQVLHSAICIIYRHTIYSITFLFSFAHIIKHFSYIKHANLDFMYCIAYIVNKYVVQ